MRVREDVLVSRISIVVHPPSLPSGCIRETPFPTGLHRRQPAATANLDKTQEQRVRGDSSSERKKEGKEGELQHRFKIRLLFPRMCGYLQILQRYRTYGLPKVPPRIRRIDNKQSRTHREAIFYLPVQNFLRIAAFRSFAGRKEPQRGLRKKREKRTIEDRDGRRGDEGG